MKSQSHISTRFMAAIFAVTLVLGGCKEDKKTAATESASADNGLSTDKNGTGVHAVTNQDDGKDKKKNNDDLNQIDEKAVDLKQLEKIWPTLDFKKNKIRVEGYVQVAGINDKLKKCGIWLSFYPYIGLANGVETLNFKNLGLVFDGAYEDKAECEALAKHKISAFVEKPMENAPLVGVVKEDLAANEDAAEDYNQFYPNLIAGKYKDLKILALEEFKTKAVDLKKEFLKAAVLKAEVITDGCKLVLAEGDKGEFIQTNFKTDKDNDRSETKLTAENCTSVAGKEIVLRGSIIKDGDGQIGDESYFISMQ